MGAHLASVHTNAENEFIFREFKYRYAECSTLMYVFSAAVVSRLYTLYLLVLMFFSMYARIFQKKLFLISRFNKTFKFVTI